MQSLTAKYQAMRSYMDAAEDHVQGTTINFDDYSVGSQMDGILPVTYSYTIIRDLPDIPADQDWTEKLDVDARISTLDGAIQFLLVKDLNYYLSQDDPNVFDSLSVPQQHSIRSFSASMPTVNRNEIVNYAIMYVFNYNPQYIKYPDADCTNFVSQAVHAGGWAKNYEWMGNDAWSTPAWAVAQQFWEYARSTGYAIDAAPFIPVVPIAGYPAVRLGDIVLYSQKKENIYEADNWKHAMIVTLIAGDEIYLTYHTNDTLNSPLSAVLGRIGHNVSLAGLNVTPNS